MEEWKYSFKPVSKSEWVRVIEDDLKGESIASLQKEYWPSGKVFPFHHKEDVKASKVILPDGYFTRAPLLMEDFNFENSGFEIANKKVLESLRFGTESLLFAYSALLPDQLEKILAEVHVEMVETAIVIKNLSQPVDKTLPEKFSTKILQRVTMTDDIMDDVLSLIEKGSWDQFRFVFIISNEGNWITSVVKTFQNIVALLENAKGKESDILKRCILVLEPDHFYFKQIMQTRALQLAWLNLRSNHSQELPPFSPVEIHIKRISEEGPDKFLIRASSSALAASLTGVKSICIQSHADQSVPAYYDRINRNIHHLLNIESKMYRGADPLAGSYTIDFYTRTWASSILDQMSIR